MNNSLAALHQLKQHKSKTYGTKKYGKRTTKMWCDVDPVSGSGIVQLVGDGSSLHSGGDGLWVEAFIESVYF